MDLAQHASWKNGGTFELSVALPDGMTAKLDLPRADHSTGVFADGKLLPADKCGNRWVVVDEVHGSIRLEVK